MLIHNPGEVPMMRAKGVAISPGMHTLVGLKHKKVHICPVSYYTCSIFVIVTSGCLLEL